MNTEEKKDIEKLCKAYSDIFHNESDELTFTHEVQHEIPIHTHSYMYPFVHKEEVRPDFTKFRCTHSYSANTAFSVENGHTFVCLLGTKNPPATFMSVIHTVLKDLQGKI